MGDLILCLLVNLSIERFLHISSVGTLVLFAAWQEVVQQDDRPEQVHRAVQYKEDTPGPHMDSESCFSSWHSSIIYFFPHTLLKYSGHISQHLQGAWFRNAFPWILVWNHIDPPFGCSLVVTADKCASTVTSTVRVFWFMTTSQPQIRTPASDFSRTKDAGLSPNAMKHYCHVTQRFSGCSTTHEIQGEDRDVIPIRL